MIRHIQQIILVIWIAIVSGCATDDQLIIPNKEETRTERSLADVFGQSDVYIRLNLRDILSRSNGSETVSRAVTQPDATYTDGDYNEFRFRNAFVLLFTGASEEQAILKSVTTANEQGMYLTDDPYVTSEVTYVQQIKANNIPATDNIYLLVAMNASQCFTSPTPDTLRIVGDATRTNRIGKTLGQLNQAFASTFAVNAEANNIASAVTGFTMTNATRYLTQDGKPHTLVKIDLNNIYATKEQAQNSQPAATIYLQRLAAKVTIKDGLGNSRILGAYIDNSNRKTYLTQQVENVSPWNDLPFLHQAAHGRYLFSIDPNYGIYGNLNDNITTAMHEAIDTDFNRREWTPAIQPVGQPMYCAENTFTLNGMRDNFTTRLVVAYRWSAGSFYIDKSDPSTTPLTADQMKQVLTDAVLNNHKFKEGVTNVQHRPDYTGTQEAPNATDIELTLSDPDPTGRITITNIQASNAGVTRFGLPSKELIFPDENGEPVNYVPHIMEDVNANTPIYFYKDGVCYYPIRIRHFSDAETGRTVPWNPGANQSEYYNSTDLGRWGVVRNNWYEVNITGNAPTKIGYAGIPSYDDTFDDSATPYFTTTFTVMPWVDHEYTHDFVTQ